MARIRTVKPEIWSDEHFMDLTLSARLVFIASLNFADDFGVLADKPRTLAARCMPGDNLDSHAVVNELVAARFYVRHAAPDGTPVLVIRTFASHQRIDKRTRGRWGDPADWTESHTISGGPPPIPPNPHQSPPIPTTEGKGREGNGREWNGTNTPTQSRDMFTEEPTKHDGTEEPIKEDPTIAAALDQLTETRWANANQTKIDSPVRWKKAVRRKLAEEHGPELLRLRNQYPDAPYGVIAAASQGETRSLANYPQQQPDDDEENAA
jgi:hypothetical protein